jgi:hypothetical protein
MSPRDPYHNCYHEDPFGSIIELSSRGQEHACASRHSAPVTGRQRL